MADLNTGNADLYVAAYPLDGFKSTYSACSGNLTVAASPTDVFTITGSATKIIRVLNIQFSNTQTTATANNITLLKRSTANTLGTSTILTAVSHDSANVAATAVVRSYTANPTVGTLVGNIRNDKVFGSTTSTTPVILRWDFGIRPTQALVLRGVNEVLAINLGAQSFTGSSINIDIEWSEE